jgi:hypothetical protein
VSAPENFSDFDRYRVWIVRNGEVSPSPESLATTHTAGRYGFPGDFPFEDWPSGAQADDQRTLASCYKRARVPLQSTGHDLDPQSNSGPLLSGL